MRLSNLEIQVVIHMSLTERICEEFQITLLLFEHFFTRNIITIVLHHNRKMKGIECDRIRVSSIFRRDLFMNPIPVLVEIFVVKSGHFIRSVSPGAVRLRVDIHNLQHTRISGILLHALAKLWRIKLFDILITVNHKDPVIGCL